MSEQEIRAQALAAASRMTKSGNIGNVVGAAELLAEWIRSGKLPKPAEGTYY